MAAMILRFKNTFFFFCFFLLAGVLMVGCTVVKKSERGAAIAPASEEVEDHFKKIPLFIQHDDGHVTQLHVEVVATEELRQEGLMFREKLERNEGMLFLFDHPDQLSFWMKNTLIPLDIIFIDADHKVGRVLQWAMPCQTEPCPQFGSLNPAQYVLEINGGLSEQLGIVEGTLLRW